MSVATEKIRKMLGLSKKNNPDPTVDYPKIMNSITDLGVNDPIKNLKLNKDPEAAWIENWLNNRRGQLASNIKNDSAGPRDEFNNLYHLVTGKKRELVNEEFYRQKNNIDSTRVVNAEEYTKLNGHEPNGWGVYNYGTHSLYSFPGEDSTEVHERTHSALPLPQTASIAKMLKGKKFKPTSDEVKSSPNYYYDPDEIYGRMMQIRYDNKLDPNKKLNLEDIKILRSKNGGQWNLDSNELFNQFDDDTLLQLLNNVASVDNQSNDVSNV